MIRAVDLTSYLPPFIADYKEIGTALAAEDPEFTLVWEAADRTLKNEFIATADEGGISRYENILKVVPSVEDTLESRRARVQARWFTTLPYTWRMFIQKLIALCGENSFSIIKQFDFYKVELNMQLELFGQIRELEKIVETMFPCNMLVKIKNELSYEIAWNVCGVGSISFTEELCIASNTIEYINLQGQKTPESLVTVTECVDVRSEE